jgi:hypothetical protein
VRVTSKRHLVTDCLQWDFVRPLTRFDPLSNWRDVPFQQDGLRDGEQLRE